MFAIKAEVTDPSAKFFVFSAQKTMYGGKHIAQGDTIFVFASENEGGSGLIASGIVTSARAIAKKRGIARQTPRVSITIRRTAAAKRSVGRRELKPSSDWDDGRPETELNFKFYRQATNKIVRISDDAASRTTCQTSNRIGRWTSRRPAGARKPERKKEVRLTRRFLARYSYGSCGTLMRFGPPALLSCAPSAC